jgi:hypothetical protein
MELYNNQQFYIDSCPLQPDVHKLHILQFFKFN